MIQPGLVSITFRQLSAAQVCRLAADHGLRGVEWGGDVHVPAGDLGTARQVAALTREHGLEVAAYGSYHRLGVSSPTDADAVIQTAVELGALRIRVWCGHVGSAEADADTRQRVADAGRRMSEQAAEAGLAVVSEWHGQTLTDTPASATALQRAVGHPAFRTYWQPHKKIGVEEALADLDAALPWLEGVHVFQWHPQTAARQPLAEGETIWPRVFEKIRRYRQRQESPPMFALLEFVADDDPANLPRDADTLRRWLAV